MSEGFLWLHQPAVRLAQVKMNQGCIVATPLFREQSQTELYNGIEIAEQRQPLELTQLPLRFGQLRLAVGVEQEELDRLLGLPGDQPERLERRLDPVVLDQVDGGPAELVGGDLGKAESGLQPGLPDRALPDGYAFAPSFISAAEHGGEHIPPRSAERELN